MAKFWIFIELEGNTTKENIKEDFDSFMSGGLFKYNLVIGEVK